MENGNIDESTCEMDGNVGPDGKNVFIEKWTFDVEIADNECIEYRFSDNSPSRENIVTELFKKGNLNWGKATEYFHNNTGETVTHRITGWHKVGHREQPNKRWHHSVMYKHAQEGETLPIGFCDIQSRGETSRNPQDFLNMLVRIVRRGLGPCNK